MVGTYPIRTKWFRRPCRTNDRPTDPLLAAVANNSPMISLNKCGHNNV